ncbi:MAG: hypothetical protein ACOYOV_16790, partial [Bacteroidales bacterium]
NASYEPTGDMISMSFFVILYFFAKLRISDDLMNTPFFYNGKPRIHSCIQGFSFSYFGFV